MSNNGLKMLGDLLCGLEEKVVSSLEFLILARDGNRAGMGYGTGSPKSYPALFNITPSHTQDRRLLRWLNQSKTQRKQQRGIRKAIAYQRGSADNITIVVVRFLVNQGESTNQ